MNSANKTIRIITIVGIFVTPFLALIVPNGMFFPFITGKNFTFRILVEIITAGWVILAVVDPKYRPRWNWLIGALAIFVGVMLIADFHGVYPYKSFWSNYERMEGWITLIHLLAYFVVLACVLNTEKLWNWFWNTTIAGSLIVAFYGLLQFLDPAQFPVHQGSNRLDASLGNSAYLAIYLVFTIFLTAYLVLSPDLFLFYKPIGKKQGFTQKAIFGGIIIILEAFVLFETATRGAILGLIGGVALTALLIAVFEKSRPQLRKTSIGVLTAAVVIVLAFLAVKNVPAIKNNDVLGRFSSISLSDETTQSRFDIWALAWKGFEERPILGWGQENFNYVFNQFYNPKMYGDEQWFDRAHDIVFDWLIAGGAVGLASYFFFFGSILWFVWKKPARGREFSATEKSLFTGLLAGYLVNNIFVFDNLTSYLLFIGVAAYVCFRAWENPNADKQVPKMAAAGSPSNSKQSTRIRDAVIWPVTIAVMIIVIYELNWKPIAANFELIAAINSTSNTDVSANTADFTQTINDRTFGTPEAREQLATFAEQVISQEQQNQVRVTGDEALYDYAVAQMKDEVNEKPNDARYTFLTGILLSQAGDPDALTYLKEAAAESPNKQSILYELANAYLTGGDITDALSTLKSAYEADTDDVQAQLSYAAVAIYDKNLPLANSILSGLPIATIAGDQDIISAYNEIGQYAAVVQLWQTVIAGSPNDPQNYIHLATAYLEEKDLKDALTALQKAQSLDTASNSAEYQTYIDEIKKGENPLTMPQAGS